MEHGQSPRARVPPSTRSAALTLKLSFRSPLQSEDELLQAHEQARVAAEASGHTTSRRLKARAAVLEQRRLDALAAAAAAAVADADDYVTVDSPSPPASSVEDACGAPALAGHQSMSSVLVDGDCSSSSASSVGVLISESTSFSVYSDDSASAASSGGSSSTGSQAALDHYRTHPASRPISPINSDQFMLSPSSSYLPLVAPLTPPPTRPALRPKPSSASISSSNSASSADSLFPATPGAKTFKMHPLPGLEGGDDDDDEAVVREAYRSQVHHKHRPSGSLQGAQFALAKLHGLELQPSDGTGAGDATPHLLHPHPQPSAFVP